MMNTLELADHGPVIPVIVLDRVQDAVPLARALVHGGLCRTRVWTMKRIAQHMCLVASRCSASLWHPEDAL